jgi:hypothetical protein
MVSIVTLPPAVIYLVLMLASVVGLDGEFAVDYLQDGAPAFSLVATRPVPSDSGVVRITAEPVGDGEDLVYVAEPSDLAGHNYLVYRPGDALPLVMNLAPAYEEAARVGIADGSVLEFPADAVLVSGGEDLALAGTVHVVRRVATVLLSAPSSGITLLAVAE